MSVHEQMAGLIFGYWVSQAVAVDDDDRSTPHMLAMFRGEERTLAEFDALLADAGLRRTAVRSPDSPQKIIEAVAV